MNIWHVRSHPSLQWITASSWGKLNLFLLSRVHNLSVGPCYYANSLIARIVLLPQTIAMRALSSIAPLLRTLSTASKPLRVAAVLGSTRVEGPPLPAPLGTRVGAWIAACARARGLDVDVIDPIVEDLPLMWRPHFTYPKDKVPSRMDPLSDRLRNADAYIMITPE